MTEITSSFFNDMYIGEEKMAGLNSWLPKNSNINILEVENGYIISKDCRQFIARTEKEACNLVLKLLKEKKNE